MHIAEWCRRRRRTLTWLSQESRVSYQTLIDLKHGRIVLDSYRRAKRISDATGGEVSIEDLCTRPKSARPPGRGVKQGLSCAE
jgi:hypothetical protein